MKNALTFYLLFLFSVPIHAQIITTVAGIDTFGYNGDNIAATAASLYAPIGVAVDGHGNLYISDTYNNRIRMVDSNGIIVTIAGTGNGGYNGDNIPATTAEIFHPTGIIYDHSGNLYFADAFNSRIRKIDPTGIITTVAGNGDTIYNGDNILADSAAIYAPYGIAFDNIGNMYISDYNHRVRKVNIEGVITTIAGTGIAGYTGDNGPATAAEIIGPYGIVTDDTGNIYFADYNANVVRKITTSGIITTFAGTGMIGLPVGDDGPADSAKLSNPTGVAIDSNENIYIADASHDRVRMVASSTNIITTIAGNGLQGFSGDAGLAISAEFHGPAGIAIDASGGYYVADFDNDRIRHVASPLSIHQLSVNGQSLIIYPDPSQGHFTLKVVDNINEQVRIIITNAIGQNVKEASAYTNIPFTIQLYQPPGIYCLSAITASGRINKMINIFK